jgi:poly(3-hydroxybutyrate) depolymerase
MTLRLAHRIFLFGLLVGSSLACGAETSGSGPLGGGHAGANSGGSDEVAGSVTAAGESGGAAHTGGAAGGASATAGSSSMMSAPIGDAGDASSTDGGPSPTMPSAGCGMAAGQALNSWVEQPKLSVNGQDRQWWVWLPTNYDPTRAYPVVFTFHGCGSPDNYVPMQKVTGGSAILVRGTGITAGCWTYGANGDDVKFFDAMLDDVLAKRCVDSSRVFATGYSSGSWLVNTLDCMRGDKLRATGTVSGGVAISTTSCKGEYARIFIHDLDDTTNRFDTNGNKAELARLVKANHCTDAAPVPEDPAPCARYQGCDSGYPVIMCQTMGKMHDRQDTLATSAFWKLFSSL